MTAVLVPTTLLEAALSYAHMGYPVFPVVGKIPLKGVRWREDATTDEEQIRAWWEANPEANIAMPTGEASGILVLDVDGDEGRNSLRRLQTEHGALPLTHMVMTPRGVHRYFEWQHNLTNSAGKLGKGLDVRGEGGYVVVPPSKREEGSYRGKRLGSEPIAALPNWLVVLLEPVSKLDTTQEAPKRADLEGRGEFRHVEGAQLEQLSADPRRAKAAANLLEQAAKLEEGERNLGTFKLAIGLRRVATTEEEYQKYRERLLKALPYGPGSNGWFTEYEAERTIRSAEGRAILGEWEPTGPLGLPPLTETRREILVMYAWAYVQPWKGKAGTYNRLGYRIILSVAFKVNRLSFDLSVREFAEHLGTRSLRTASNVLRRLEEQEKIRRRPGETTDDPSIIDVLRKGNSLSIPPTVEHSVLPICNSTIVPDAFRQVRGLPKTALLLLDYLDEPRTTRELMDLSGKVRSTILRNLKPLEEHRLIVNTEGKWARTNRSLDEVARKLGTHGARERQRDYNQEQRAIRDLRRKDAEAV